MAGGPRASAACRIHKIIGLGQVFETDRKFARQLRRGAVEAGTGGARANDENLGDS